MVDNEEVASHHEQQHATKEQQLNGDGDKKDEKFPRRHTIRRAAEDLLLDVKGILRHESKYGLVVGEWTRNSRELMMPRLPSLQLTYTMLDEATALVRGGWKTKSTLQLHKSLLGSWQQIVLKRQLHRNETHLRNGEYGKIVNPITEGMQAYMSAGNESLLDCTNHAEVAEIDNKKRNDVDRTAALIYALGQIRDDVMEERWSIEQVRGKPVEMRGYKRLFSKREPGEKADTLIDVINSSHVTVVIDGRFFRLNLINKKGEYLTPEELRHNLQQMKSEAARSPHDDDGLAKIDAGHLTTLPRREWHRVKEEIKKDTDSRESLLDIDNSLMTFVMDTNLRPVTLEERSSLALYGKYYRRDIQTGEMREYIGSGGWYDGPCIRTAANGMTSGNFEHLGADGSETMTFFDRLLEASEKVTFEKTRQDATVAFRPLEIHIADELQHEAYDVYTQETKDQKVGALVVGKEKGITYNDSLVQIALFLAQYDVSKRQAAYFIEPVNLRAFMNGRLGYGLINLRAIHRYAEWVVDHKVLHDSGKINEDAKEMQAMKQKGAQLLQEAIASHKQMLALVKEGESPLNHLTTLTGSVHQDPQSKGAFVRAMEAVFSRLDAQVRDMLRANIVTNGGKKDHISSFMTIGTKNENGTGIGFSIEEDRVVFTIRAKGEMIEKIDELNSAIDYYMKYVVTDLKLGTHE